MNAAPLINIRTITDLNRVLSIQQIQARKARMAMNAGIDSISPPVTEQEEEAIGALTIEKNAELLQRYARKPTFTEFNARPTLDTLLPWGETFAVAALVAEIILHHVRQLQDGFVKEHARLLTLLLRELDSLNSNDVVAELAKTMRVNLRDTGLNEAEQQKLVYSMVRSLVQAMMLVLVDYKLVEIVPGGYRLTGAGKRVMLHLVDVQRFIAIVVEAHTRLKSELPSTEALGS